MVKERTGLLLLLPVEKGNFFFLWVYIQIIDIRFDCIITG